MSDYHGPTSMVRWLGPGNFSLKITQLFRRAIETPNIENEHGVPWQVVYGISDNARAFWSLSNARKALGYEPEDDSDVKFADDIAGFLVGEGVTARPVRVQPIYISDHR